MLITRCCSNESVNKIEENRGMLKCKRSKANSTQTFVNRFKQFFLVIDFLSLNKLQLALLLGSDTSNDILLSVKSKVKTIQRKLFRF